jgi:hypothetical protein
MTDLRDVLDTAAGSPPSPTPDVVGADVRRGHRALTQRRWGRAGGVAVAASLLAAGAVMAPGILGGDDRHGVVATPGSGSADASNPGVDLVAFDGGPAPKPLSPTEVPDGWTVSGDRFALVIAPPGNDTSPADYRGKLVVYLDANTIPNESLPMKVAVDVGDRTGFAIRAEPSMLQVWVPQEDGTALRAQAPESLGWDEGTLGRFLGGVVVGEGATAGVG